MEMPFMRWPHHSPEGLPRNDCNYRRDGFSRHRCFPGTLYIISCIFNVLSYHSKIPLSGGVFIICKHLGSRRGVQIHHRILWSRRRDAIERRWSRHVKCRVQGKYGHTYRVGLRTQLGLLLASSPLTLVGPGKYLTFFRAACIGRIKTRLVGSDDDGVVFHFLGFLKYCSFTLSACSDASNHPCRSRKLHISRSHLGVVHWALSPSLSPERQVFGLSRLPVSFLPLFHSSSGFHPPLRLFFHTSQRTTLDK